jgi:hypothetical protein
MVTVDCLPLSSILQQREGETSDSYGGLWSLHYLFTDIKIQYIKDNVKSEVKIMSIISASTTHPDDLH